MDSDAPRSLKSRTVPFSDFFWDRVDKSGECWVWTGSRSGGYGVVKYAGTRKYAHRVSLEISGVELADDAMVDHLCHNPPCIRPAHLRVATTAQNLQNLRGAQVNSRSGVRGVYQDTGGSGWVAEVKADGVRHRRRFQTLIEAAEWAEETRARLHKVPTIT